MAGDCWQDGVEHESGQADAGECSLVSTIRSNKLQEGMQYDAHPNCVEKFGIVAFEAGCCLGKEQLEQDPNSMREGDTRHGRPLDPNSVF